MEGWIKLHRKFINWEWYEDPQVKILFLHCLLKANHKDKKWRGITIKKGTFITSYETLSREVGLSNRSVRTALSKLEKTGEVTRQSTHQGTCLSVCNYETYQDSTQSSDTQIDKRPTHDRHTTDTRPTTTKNDKKEKNEKNNTYKKEFETFWSLYPKKVNKGRAETTFLRVRKKTSLEVLLNGLKTSPQMHREKQYIPNAQAWLNGQGWEDEVDNEKLPFPQPHLQKYRLGAEDVFVDMDKCIVYNEQGVEHPIYEYSNGMITS